jgi:hypothetical protein
MAVPESGLASSNVAENDYPAWSATTVYPMGSRVMVASGGVHKIYESLTGSSSPVTITVGAPTVINWTAHGVAADTPVTFTTTGNLPVGMTVGTTYYVLATGLTVNSFQFSATIGGAAVGTSGSQLGTQTASASLNFNKPTTNPTYWLDTGATNRWKMFDQSVQSQTSNATSIDVSINLNTRIDSVSLINIDCASVRIILTNSVDGVVYDKTYPTASSVGISDYYTWFFEPVLRTTDLVVTNLPPYASGVLRVILDAPGGTAKCGCVIAGLSLNIGTTEVGVKVGTQDYSIKTRDNFGNFVITQRAFAKRASFSITTESPMVDKLQNILAAYRAVPIVYVGSASYGATIIYGFYKSFDIDIGYIDGTSSCTLDVEGLT